MKHLKNTRGRLVDRHKHNFVVRHIADDLHDVLGILRAETTGGLIEKKDVGRTDHIEADVQALAFAAAEDFFFRRADNGCPAFVQAEFSEFAIDAAQAFATAEVRGADGGRVFQIFFDGEVFVEGIVLRNVGHVFPQGFVIFVERAFVEKDTALGWAELAREGAQKRAFAAAAGTHHTDHLATLDRKGHSVDGERAVRETAYEVLHIECADDIFLLLDEAFREVAAKNLASIDADRIAIFQQTRISHRHPAHDDRSVGLKNLHLAYLAFIVARNFQ